MIRKIRLYLLLFMATICLTIPVFATFNLSNGLLHVWSFNENATNNKTIDIVDGDINVTYFNGTTVVGGKKGNAIYFNDNIAGTQTFRQKAVTDSNASIIGANPRTYSGWYYINQWTTKDQTSAWFVAGLGSATSCSGFSPVMHYGIGGGTNVGDLYVALQSCDFSDTGVGDVNNWQLFTMTYDGTTLRVYLNATETTNYVATLATGTAVIYWGGTYPANYTLDEFYVWNRSLNASEVANLYNQGVGLWYEDSLPNGTWVGNFSLSGNATPLNATGWNQNYMNFSQGVIINNDTINCTLRLNNLVNQSKTLSYGTIGVNTNITFGTVFNTPAWINWSINCTSTKTWNVSATAIQTFWLDTVNPSIVTNFVNNSVLISGNLTAMVNVSDDFWLYTYNASIDGINYQEKKPISNTSKQFNFSYSLSALSVGKHLLSFRVSDGHTKNTIGDYEIDTGLFGNQLKFSYVEEGQKMSIKIKQKDSSVFDSFHAYKEVDRYTWDFVPASIKENYTFEVESDSDIFVVDAPETPFKKWLIIGQKWVDFYLPSENAIVTIERQTDKKYWVTVGNLQNPGLQSFKSIGELNIVVVNYTFYRVNVTLSYANISVFDSQNTFLLNITGFENAYITPSAYLVWNNSVKTATKVDSNNNTVFNATFTTNPLNNASFTYYFNFSTTPGTYNLSGNQSVINVYLDNCSTATTQVLNYSIYSELGLSPLAGGIQGLISYYYNSALSLKNLNFSRTNISVFSICMYPSDINLNLYSAIITATATGYEDRTSTISSMVVNSTTQKINLYLLDSSNSTTVTARVSDIYDNSVEGAYIKVLRYYPDLASYIEVQSKQTNFLGETSLDIVMYSVLYKFIVEYNGRVYYASQVGAPVTRTSMTFRIDLTSPVLETFEGYTNYNYRLYYANDSTTFVFIYDDVSGIATYNCLRTYTYRRAEELTINDTCLTTSTGQINGWINTTNGGIFEAYAYIIDASGLRTPIDHVSATYNSTIVKSLGRQGGFLTLIMVGSVALMFIGNPLLALVIFVVSITTFGYLGFIPMTYTIGISIVILAIVVLIILEGRKKNR